MAEIRVHSQEEFNAIPDDCIDKIYIEFGTKDKPAIVDRSFYYPVIVDGECFAEVRNHSSVYAYGHSSVYSKDHSYVVSRFHSSVTSMGHSYVYAYGNSSVTAHDKSKVIHKSSGKVTVHDNAKVVTKFKDIYEFMDFFDIQHDDTEAIFYKAVHKDGDLYRSDHDSDFTYSIGEVKEEICNPDIDIDCSYGINISYLDWALRYGSDWDDLAILEVETDIKDIVMPNKYTDCKVRTSKIKVLREVPLDE